jgi:hypothetical protein
MLPFITRIIQAIVVILALVAVYYLYRYLYGEVTRNSTMLIQNKIDAKTDAKTPILIEKSKLIPIHEGGEFTLSFWLYVSNWNYKLGKNKHIISIGGSAPDSFDTIRVYMGGYRNNLKVRLHTSSSLKPTGSTADMSTSSGGELFRSNMASLFENLQADSSLDDGSAVCDLPDLDLQRWIQVTIVASGKTVDVYMDGKLARSCVLPSIYKVDQTGYTATLLGYTGFGGMMSKSMLYNYALAPDEIYRNYMQGPGEDQGFLQYLKSFFSTN